MGNFTMAFMVVLSINLMMWLGQVAVLSENPTGVNFVDYDGNIFNKWESGNFELNESDPYNMLPSGSGAVDPETGNVFTDVFNSIKGWVAEKSGARYLMQVVSAPYNFLEALHLPVEFVYAVGTFWYLLTLLLFVLMMWGRDN